MILRKTLSDLSGCREIFEKIWRVAPALCGYLLPVSFGMMLGWPSLAYPHLLDWEISPIQIDLSQSSLVAGFLMEGNSIGVLFSTTKFLGSKTAVFLCFCLQFFGWCVMLGANDIIGLFISRASVGFGAGCGIGHLKRYIKETCEPDLAERLTHYIPVGVQIGVLLIYTAGAFIQFRTMALFAMMVPFFATIIFGLLPKRMLNGETDAVTKNVFKNTLTLDLAKVEECPGAKKADEDVKVKSFDWTIWIGYLKETETRNSFLLIFLIVFLQQYTGGPANIVYSQIIFEQTKNPYPKICSIIYAIFFLGASISALNFAKNVPRRANVLTSCGMVVLTTALMSLYFHLSEYLHRMTHHFTWAPLFVTVLFVVFHTFGIATVPLQIVAERIPQGGRTVANQMLTIHFSLSAVISTKIFQKLFEVYDMCVAYAFFASVGLMGFVLLALLMRDYDPVEKMKKSAMIEKKMADKVEIEIVTRF